MTKTERVASGLLKPINPTVVIVLGLYTVVWGLWIFSPFWNVFDAAPLYSAMASIFPSEYVWGGIAIVAGNFIMRGAIHPSRRNLQFGAFTGALHWFVIALLYFAGDWTSTGGITSLTFAAYAALVWVNIKVNPEHFPDKPTKKTR